MRKDDKDRIEFSLITFSHVLIHIFPASIAPLLPLIKTEFNLSYTGVGLLTFILSLCWAFSGIPAGIASDKMDRIKLIVFMFFLVSIFSAIITLMSTLPGVLLLLILLFLTIGIFHPPAYSYLSYRYPRKKGKMVGIFETGGSVGILIAPIVAGIVGSCYGWRYVYTFWAIPAFIMAFLLYLFSSNNRLKDCRVAQAKKKKINKEQSSQKRRPSFYHPHFKAIYLTQGFFGFVSGGSISFLPLFLTDVHKLSTSTAGGMLTVFLAGGALGKVIGGRCSDAFGARKIIGIGFLITSFFLLLIPLVTSFFLVFVLLPAGIVFFMILPALILLTGEIKTSDLGLAYGIQVLSGATFGAFSRLLCGTISDLLGIKFIFFLLSVIALFSAIFVYSYLKKTR